MNNIIFLIILLDKPTKMSIQLCIDRRYCIIMEKRKKARIEAKIKTFKNTDFSDCPILTEEQIKEFKPSHLRNMANYKPIKKNYKYPP